MTAAVELQLLLATITGASGTTDNQASLSDDQGAESLTVSISTRLCTCAGIC